MWDYHDAPDDAMGCGDGEDFDYDPSGNIACGLDGDSDARMGAPTRVGDSSELGCFIDRVLGGGRICDSDDGADMVGEIFEAMRDRLQELRAILCDTVKRFRLDRGAAIDALIARMDALAGNQMEIWLRNWSWEAGDPGLSSQAGGSAGGDGSDDGDDGDDVSALFDDCDLGDAEDTVKRRRCGPGVEGGSGDGGQGGDGDFDDDRLDIEVWLALQISCHDHMDMELVRSYGDEDFAFDVAMLASVSDPFVDIGRVFGGRAGCTLGLGEGPPDPLGPLLFLPLPSLPPALGVGRFALEHASVAWRPLSLPWTTCGSRMTIASLLSSKASLELTFVPITLLASWAGT